MLKEYLSIHFLLVHIYVPICIDGRTTEHCLINEEDYQKEIEKHQLNIIFSVEKPNFINLPKNLLEI